MKIADSIVDLIGNTPLVRLRKIPAANGVEILLKLESQNPYSSVKDRIGIAMIEAAEASGRLTTGATIVEATSGNTGIAIAFAAVVKGYKVILTMPETMSVERRRLLEALGAEVILTDASDGMGSAVRMAQDILDTTPGAVSLNQFDNPANPAIHADTTAEEIWRDTDGHLDAFVAGVGTGGTVSGVGSSLKSHNPAIKVYAVEPWKSAVLTGGVAAPHKIQGIGAGFIPANFHAAVVDEIVTAKEEDAGYYARLLARQEGILAGVSSGAALWAALELAKRPENAGKRFVVLLPDSGERYLSTWLFDYIDIAKVGLSASAETAPKAINVADAGSLIASDSKAVAQSVNYFKNGLYCSEAILRAFNEHYSLGLPASALKMATGFGAGLGASKCACGSVTGAAMVLSAIAGRTESADSEEKVFQTTALLHDRFKAKYKALCCRSLTRNVEWGSAGHKSYCERLVWEAAAIIDDLITQHLSDRLIAAGNNRLPAAGK